MNIKRILLTGGRAPATLELARLFFLQGHEIHIAESFLYSLTRKSASVTKFHLVAEPKFHPQQFIEEIAFIIQKEKIDLLIPTCEEIFYIASFGEHLNSLCDIWIDTKEQLLSLHNKYEFIKKASSFGLTVPKTFLLKNEDDWKKEKPFQNAVCKPVYSRFSTKVLFLPEDEKQLNDCDKTIPWVYQEKIVGKTYCSYAVCIHGKIMAHSVYPSIIRAGDGATIYFEHIEHAKIQLWVKKFVEKTKFHGQIAFDFIENEQGEVYAIECNPRLTSGIHLFRGTNVASAFLGEQSEILPNNKIKVAIKMAMLFYLFQNSKKLGFQTFWKMYKEAKDVVYQKQDPKPFYEQLKSFYHFYKKSKIDKISILEATTADISWDYKEE